MARNSTDFDPGLDEQLPELPPVGADARTTAAPILARAAGDPLPLPPSGEPRRLEPEGVYGSPREPLAGRALRLFETRARRRERELDDELERARTRGLPGSWVIAVGSQKGGAGKSTAVRIVSEQLSAALHERVLVLELDELGTIVEAVPTSERSEKTVVDVYEDRALIAHDGFPVLGRLQPYLCRLGFGAQLLRSPYTEEQLVRANSPELLEAVLSLVARLFPIVLLDLGPGAGIQTPVIEWAFENSDRLVVVANPLPAGVNQAHAMLEILRRRAPDKPLSLLLNTLPEHKGFAKPDVIAAAARLADRGAFVRVPADLELNHQVHTAQIDIGRLAQATRIQLKRFALHLADTWTPAVEDWKVRDRGVP